MGENKYRDVEAEVVLDIITDILFDNATLSYNKEYLCFDGDALRAILKSRFPRTYDSKYKELMDEYNERDKKDGNNDN